MSADFGNDKSTVAGGWNDPYPGRKPDATQDTRAAVENTARKVGAQAQSVLDDAKAAAGQQAEKAREYTAGSLGEAASALHKAADDIPEGSVRQTLLREAADGLGQIAQSMENKSVGDIARELSDFGRRHPAAFLGGAALFGLAIARFVRASAPDDSSGGRYRGEATEFSSDTGARGGAYDRDAYRASTEE